MIKKIIFVFYYVKSRIVEIYNNLTKRKIVYHVKKKVAGRKVSSADSIHKLIYQHICEGRPVMVGRLGNTEQRMIISTLKYRMFPKRDSRKQGLEWLCELSGFFPNNETAGDMFSEMMLESCKQIDIIAYSDISMRDYALRYYLRKETVVTGFESIFPWCSDLKNELPWSRALKGKKVLVVYPFAVSIKKQYENNRTNIFRNIYDAENILPEFELITLKAVQTLGGENTEQYESWFAALHYMVEKCRQIDFDVAIIGCGAYGFPLAAEIKKMGKIAIHLGGATQLMFGVYGDRWLREAYKDFKEQVINDCWIRPSNEETPKNKDRVEEGCYW